MTPAARPDSAAALGVAVVADDLTGAADCALAFRGAGRTASVILDPRAVADATADVLVVPTDSRDAERGAAGRAAGEAAARLARRRPALWYKKIDSTLRGHIAHELAAVREVAGASLTIVAPAFPAQGRTLRDGRGYLDGTALEHTPTWRAHGLTHAADLPALLAAHDLPVRHADLAAVRSGAAGAHAAAGDVIVCDAEIDDDLDAIAATPARESILWVGSAGLAYALAGRGRPADGPRRDERPVAAGPVVVVVGSAAPQAHEQAGRLGAALGAATIVVDPARPRGPDAPNALSEALADGRDVALVLAPPAQGARLRPALGRELAGELGGLVAAHVGGIGGLVLTGGDTARAVLAACRATELRVAGAVEPGVPLSVAWPGGLPVVTKAGAFGDGDALVRAAGALRAGRPVAGSSERG